MQLRTSMKKSPDGTMRNCRQQASRTMVGRVCMLLGMLLWVAPSLAETGGEVSGPPEIVSGAPPAAEPGSEPHMTQTEKETIYESRFFPGFRPCTPQDYHDHDFGPVACQDPAAARALSSPNQEYRSDRGLMEADTVSQGNIYKLRFGRTTKGAGAKQ